MRLCAVVVVYGQFYKDTQSYVSLSKVVQRVPDLLLDVIIYDNSPKEQIIEEEPFNNIIYYHDPRNIGVVPAYRVARDYCNHEGIQWLLRLDQDSSFDETLINEFLKVSQKNKVKIIVPKVECKGEIVSPSYIRIGGVYVSVPESIIGINRRPITFINSMSFINVSDRVVSDSLDAIKCQLDLSDHEFARMISDLPFYIMEIKVSHSLSIKEEEYVSPVRYNEILKNEVSFMNRYENLIGRIIFQIRLLLRMVKFYFKGRKELAAITIKYLLQ